MQVLLKIMGVFILQTLVEILVMSILVKFGVPYMDIEGSKEGVIEITLGIGFYYSLSKALIIVLPYVALMALGYFYGSKFFPKLKILLIVNIIVSILLTSVFWIYFENPLSELLNPILGTLIAAIFILFISKLIKKDTVDSRRVNG